MEGEPRLRWFRKKRWRLVIALLLPLAYAAGDGPAFYAVHRGWLPFKKWEAAYGWWRRTVTGSAVGRPYRNYVVWICRTAGRHRKAAEAP